MAIRVFILLCAVLVSIVVGLCFGSANLTANLVADGLLHPSSVSPEVRAILWDIRLPRALCALAAGAALSVSGYLLQTLSRNNLADPYLTGVSSGAALATAIAVACEVPFSVLPGCALAGGLLASIVVAALARTSSGISVARLLLSGIAVSALCGSFITLIVTRLAAAGKGQSLLYWLTGTINGKGWAELGSAAVYIAVGLAMAFVLSKPLRILSLGESQAAAVGLSVNRSQLLVLIAAVVLCAGAVSLSGIVGFVGLMAPYLARMLFGRDERLHLLGACAFGAVLVSVADLCARTLGDGQELPLGTLLSLVGAPFFLWLVVRRKDEVEH